MSLSQPSGAGARASIRTNYFTNTSSVHENLRDGRDSAKHDDYTDSAESIGYDCDEYDCCAAVVV